MQLPLDKHHNLPTNALVDTKERQQVRLILEEALDTSKRAIEAATKELYANASASGTLRSGDTLKKRIVTFEREGQPNILTSNRVTQGSFWQIVPAPRG